MIYLMIVLSLYSAVVEIAVGNSANDFRHVINPIFLLYNTLVISSVYFLVRKYTTRSLVVGTVISASLSVCSVYLGGVQLHESIDVIREAGTFNNPNQLGFYSTSLLSLAYLLYVTSAIRFYLLIILLIMATFIAIASLSKAAIIANFAVLFFALRPKRGQTANFIWAILVLSGITAGYAFLSGDLLSEFSFYNRIKNMMNERDSSLEVRGYFLFFEASALEVIFGLGNAEIFKMLGHEVHSTFASALNAYGIVGLLLLISVFTIWVTSVYLAFGVSTTVAITFPTIFYGATHNGIRFSIFWILVSASIAAANSYRSTRTRSTKSISTRVLSRI